MELERVVNKLLTKDRDLRYQGAAEVIADLKRLEINLDSGSGVSRTGMLPKKRRTFRPLHGVAAVAVFSLGALGAWFFAGPSTESKYLKSPIHLNLILPDSVIYSNPHWSADGTRLLFSADQGNKKGFIVEYDLTTGTLTELTDADHNRWPKYAPDTRSILFVNSGGTLMRQAVGSNQAGPVAEVEKKNGLAWISPNEIVFARYPAVLVRDLVSGLEDTLNLEIDARWFHHPAVTADSSILFAGTYFGIRAVDLSTREMLPSLEMNDDYLYGVTSNGYILYQQGNLATVWARKFDADSRIYKGQGFVLFSTLGVAVSRVGHIIYKPLVGRASSLPIEPIYVYTNGKRGAFVGHSGTFSSGDADEFRTSPDGQYLAVRIIEGGILRFERSSRTTIELVDLSIPDVYPSQFSYDGKWLYYYAKRSDVWGIYRVDSEGKNPPEPVVVADRHNLLPSISRDGITLVFARRNEETGWDIWGKNLLTQEESPIVVAEGRQFNPRISPDARFVAFDSRDVRGESSVLVTDLDSGTTIVVEEGVTVPRWDWEGAYLYYESKVLGEIYRVPFDGSAGIAFGERETMFSDHDSDHTHWDTPPEDDTILVATPAIGPTSSSPWTVILNWASTLEQ